MRRGSKTQVPKEAGCHDNNKVKTLEHNAIRSLALDWFRSYLSSRQQFVEYNKVNSNIKPVTCVVLQISVLGPLLFLVS